jgi:hypothetical protein
MNSPGGSRSRAIRRSARNGEMNDTSTIRPASAISRATSATRRMFSTRSGVREAEVAVQPVADVVAVEQIVRVAAERVQPLLDQVGDGGLAGAGQPGEPEHAGRCPFSSRARLAVHVERLPVHVVGAPQREVQQPAPTCRWSACRSG